MYLLTWIVDYPKGEYYTKLVNNPINVLSHADYLAFFNKEIPNEAVKWWYRPLSDGLGTEINRSKLPNWFSFKPGLAFKNENGETCVVLNLKEYLLVTQSSANNIIYLNQAFKPLSDLWWSTIKPY